MTTLVLSILNGSSSFFQLRKITIKAWMSLNFDKIRSPILELAPLEHLKCCDHSSAFIFDWIIFILSGYKDSYSSLNEFEIWQDPTRDL